MRAIPVSDNIHWVGGIDWNLRDFHGFETPRGTTYNAYLVQGRGHERADRHGQDAVRARDALPPRHGHRPASMSTSSS